MFETWCPSCVYLGCELHVYILLHGDRIEAKKMPNHEGVLLQNPPWDPRQYQGSDCTPRWSDRQGWIAEKKLELEVEFTLLKWLGYFGSTMLVSHALKSVSGWLEACNIPTDTDCFQYLRITNL